MPIKSFGSQKTYYGLIYQFLITGSYCGDSSVQNEQKLFTPQKIKDVVGKRSTKTGILRRHIQEVGVTHTPQ